MSKAKEFSGLQAEGAPNTLFSSPPRPQPLRFETSIKTPQAVPPPQALLFKIELR